MSQPPQYPPPGNPPPGRPGDGGQQPGGQPPDPQGPRGGSKTRLVVVLVVLAVVIVGGAAAFVLTQDDDDDGGNRGGSPAASDDGGGGASGEEQTFVDAITEANESSSAGAITTDEARCIAEATVSAVGVEMLQAATTPDEIRADPEASLSDLGVEADQAQVDQLADGADGCFDPVQFTLDALEQEGITPDVASCVEENLSSELAARYMAAYYIGSSDVRDATTSEFQEAVGPCRDLANE